MRKSSLNIAFLALTAIGGTACSVPFVSGESDAPEAVSLEDLEGCYYKESYSEDPVYQDSITNHLNCIKFCIMGDQQENREYRVSYRWHINFPDNKLKVYYSEYLGNGTVSLLAPLADGNYSNRQSGYYEHNVSYINSRQGYETSGETNGYQIRSGNTVVYTNQAQFYEKDGIKHLGEYTSEKGALCEE